MNEQPIVDASASRHFIDTLNGFPKVPGYGLLLEIAGQAWSANRLSSHDALTGHPRENVIVEVRRAYNGPGFMWDWSLKIADGVYVRHSQGSPDVVAACAEALAYTPAIHVFDYLGAQTTWYETAAGDFYGQIDGEETAVHSFDDGWTYRREWKAGSAVIKMSGQYSSTISGAAATREAAMIACIDAPERFKRACAALVASLTTTEANHA